MNKYSIGRDPSCFGGIYYGETLIAYASSITPELEALVQQANACKHPKHHYYDGIDLTFSVVTPTQSTYTIPHDATVDIYSCRFINGKIKHLKKTIILGENAQENIDKGMEDMRKEFLKESDNG